MNTNMSSVNIIMSTPFSKKQSCEPPQHQYKMKYNNRIQSLSLNRKITFSDMIENENIIEKQERKLMVQGIMVELKYDKYHISSNTNGRIIRRGKSGWLLVKFLGQDKNIKVRTSECKRVSKSQRLIQKM